MIMPLGLNSRWSRRKLNRFINEYRDRQRNIVFPGTVRNGRSVDVFLWNGSPNPLLVQRIAAWIFGLLWMAIGIAFLPLAALARDQDRSSLAYGAIMLMSAFFRFGGGQNISERILQRPQTSLMMQTDTPPKYLRYYDRRYANEA
jgi:hypothetical protein